ncbi:MAG: hypothetical protein AB7G06_08850 [Bdellovibrionales bacterium]
MQLKTLLLSLFFMLLMPGLGHAQISYENPTVYTFTSGLTKKQTARATGGTKILNDDVLLRIEGPAKRIRVLRSGVQPRYSEDELISLLPMSLKELMAKPFAIRLMDLDHVLAEGDKIKLTFIYEKLPPQTVEFSVVSVDDMRAKAEKEEEAKAAPAAKP